MIKQQAVGCMMSCSFPFLVFLVGRRAHITSSTDHPPIFETMMTTDHPFFFPWWRDISLMRKAFFSQDHGGCESLSLTRMFPTLLRKYRTPRRRIIVVLLLLLLLVVVVVVVFAKSLRSYYFQLFLWKRPKPVKVASYGDTISFSRWIFQTCIILNFRKS